MGRVREMTVRGIGRLGGRIELVPRPVPGIGTEHLRKPAPIVKWVGGKRQLAETLAAFFRPYVAGRGLGYVEPFAGSAAVAFELNPEKLRLYDACAPLMATYRAVADSPIDVAAEVARLARAHRGQRGYDQVADAWNRRLRFGDDPGKRVKVAGAFLYLNRTNYNGLWRENQRGDYNVPWGKRNISTAVGDRIAFESMLCAASRLLRRARALDPSHFDGSLDVIRRLAADGERWAIYADPPYLDTFSGYRARGFGIREHLQLAAALERLDRAGHLVAVTNSDTPFVRALYAWARVTPIVERRAVQPKRGTARRAQTLLLTSAWAPAPVLA